MYLTFQKTMKKVTVLLLAAFLLFAQCTALIPAGLFVLPANGALAEGTNNLDGSKIEGIYLEWVTPDSQLTAEGEAVPQSEFDDKAHLYLSTTTNQELTLIYRIEAQLSGQHDYDPGDVTISIPAQVWPTRAMDADQVGIADFSALQGGLELPIPEAPSTKGNFNWQRVGDQYVLTNTRKLGAASSISIEVAIRGLKPVDVVDMVPCNDIVAHCEVITTKGNTIELTSEPINAQIDTTAQLTYVHKDGKIVDDFQKVPQTMLDNLPTGVNPDDYVYAEWYTYQAHENNQPYSLSIKDVLSGAYEKDENGNKTLLAEGIFLGSVDYPGEMNPDETVDFAAPVSENVADTTPRIQHEKTVYMWSAYPKDNLYIPDANEDQVEYWLDNKVTWVLTETDGEVAAWDGTDPQKVHELSDEVTIRYSPMKWAVPPGSFIVHKWTEEMYEKDWDYGLALNRLERGQDVDMKFVVETVGYGYPWTSEYAVKQVPAPDDETLQDSYGRLSWKQVTEDYQTFFNFETDKLTAEDFEFKSLRVTSPITFRYDKAESGRYGYIADNLLEIPNLWVEYQVGGSDEWMLAAKAYYPTRNQIELLNLNPDGGVFTSGQEIFFPENTTNVRWYYISKQHTDAEQAEYEKEKSDLAGVVWHAYPTITLKASDRVQGLVADMFAETDNPATKFKNDVKMDAYQWLDNDWDYITDFADASRASLEGAGYGVFLLKEADYQQDPENDRVVVHYTLTHTEQSNLSLREEYDEAVAIGAIPEQTSGIWYDLLPPHVVPMLDSVQLRNGDSARNVYAIENYKNSGRYLLVVEADLTPQPTKESGKTATFYDQLTLEFDAAYSILELDQYGNVLDNYAAFESTVDNLRLDADGTPTLGTVIGQRGEPDQPTAGNNRLTPAMPQEIVDILTDLDPSTDENRFVYATVHHEVSALDVAVSDLKKQVRNDLGGNWTQGLTNQEQVTVYEGHPYTYDLTVSSGAKTASKDIIIYDTIENYHVPNDGTKTEDYQHIQDRIGWSGQWAEDGQWRGSLVRVELGQLLDAGVAPVLYYSTVSDLQFAETKSEETDDNYAEDTEILSSGAYDVTNAQYWQQAELVDGVWTVPEGVNVSAVAIDARQAADGSEFILMPDEHLTTYLRMRAPDDNGDSDTWIAKGAYARTEGDPNEVDWTAAQNPENNMYAFNNSRLRLMQGEYEEGIISWTTEHPRMIRNDYTRVGIVPSVMTVRKEWQDEDNHDVIRPDEVTVNVLRKVAGTTDAPAAVLDAQGQPIQLTLNDACNWTAELLQVDIVNEDGLPYLYTFEEEPVEGYEASVNQVRPGAYVIRNVHAKEMVDLSGQKAWDDSNNAMGARPDSVIVRLYRDGEEIASQEIESNGTDTWAYSFGEMPKYEANTGRAYQYEIKEDYVPKYGTHIEGWQITNTYDPYGDLLVRKLVKDATAAAEGQEFTFTLVLLEEKTDETAPDKPLEGKFTGDVTNKAGGVVRQISCGNGDSFTLKADETVVFHDLPSECRYEIIEQETAGYTIASVGASGLVMGGGDCVEAEFTNTYAASGSVQLEVGKQLTGAAIQKNKFKFELVDRTVGSETEGEVIATNRVQRPEEAATGGSGEAIESEAGVLFGALRYTQADHGKTFLYELREVDDELGGYTSDSKTYQVKVSVVDNGDGTLTVTPTYQDASGNDLSELPKFENQYNATGEVELKVWKTLDGREPGDKTFTFELIPCDENGTPISGAETKTATSNAEGVAVFDALSFTQDDVSLDPDNPAVYYYLAKEQAGTDDTVIYSTQQYLFAITVKDNGDGSLSFEQSTYAITSGEDGSTSVGTDMVVPVFANQLKPGALTVEKQVEGESGDPDQEFTFMIKLTGENIGELDYTVVLPEAPEEPDEPDDPDGPTTPDEPENGGDNGDTDTPDSGEDVESGSSSELIGKAYAMIEPNGLMTFFRSTDGKDIYGNDIPRYAFDDTRELDSTTGIYYYFIDEVNQSKYTASSQMWSYESNQVTEIVFRDRIRPGKGSRFFAGMTQLQEVDLTNLDTSYLLVMDNWFNGCYALQKVKFGDYDTSAVTHMNGMFWNCTALKEVDLSYLDSSSVVSLSNMFTKCSAIEKITFGNFSTDSVTDMSSMFSGCSALTELDLSGFDTSSVTNMSSMFSECSALTELDLSSFDTSSVTNMSNMFNKCSSLTAVDLSTFDTSSVTAMNYMFNNCSSLTELNLSGFDTSACTNFTAMFSKCTPQQVTLSADFVTTGSVYIAVPYLKPYDSKWMKKDDPTQIMTSKKLFTEEFDKAGTWVWHEATYKLDFLPGNDGTGKMGTVYPAVKDAYTFLPTFTSATHELIGFKDEANNLEYGLNPDGTCTVEANRYSANAEVTLTAQWKKKGADITISENTVTVKLQAGGSITLNNLPAGTAYEVWEELPTGWVLVSKTNDVGEIQPTVTTTSTFTNKYDPTKATVALRASKLLDGEAPEAEAFTFTLTPTYENATEEAQTKKNAAGGGVVFDTLTFDTAGTYTYTITETADAQNTAIAYDSTEYTVTVTVTTDADGNLSAAMAYAKGSEAVTADELVFSNTTKPGSLTLSKAIAGTLTDAARKKEFAFEISFADASTMPWSGTVGIEGSAETLTVSGGKATVTLKGGESITLTGLPAGITYEVTETGDLTGWAQSGATTGTIAAGETASCTITNTYNGLSGDAYVVAEKQLLGRDLEVDEFTFQLVGADNQVISQASNGAGGAVRFDPIHYTQEGTYQYVIVEVPSDDDTIVYSQQRINVTVEVKDENANGKLTCTVTYPEGGAVVTNQVKTGHLAVAKTVDSSNATHSSQKFPFTIALTNANGTPYTGTYSTAATGGETVQVSGGQVQMELAHGETFTLYNLPVGTQYTVAETPVAGFTAACEGDTGSVVADKAAQAVFTNTYHAEGEFVLEARKDLLVADGIILNKTLEAGQFTFVIADTAGNEIGTATNDADGNVVFDAILYDETDVGEHSYILFERNDAQPGYVYSEDEHTIVVTVADNGDGTLSATTLFSGADHPFENTFTNKTSISVEKSWQDDDNRMGARPDSVTVQLYQNKVAVKGQTATLSETNGWAYTFDDLPAEDEQGIAYVYEVREVAVPLYQAASSVMDDKTSLTNTLVTEGALEVSKTVVDGDETKAFTFTVTLTKDGAALAAQPVILEMNGTYTSQTTDGDGKVTFSLKHGQKVQLLGLPYGTAYSVEETAEAGYTAEATGDTGTVVPGTLHQAVFTNTYAATGELELSGTKTLEGRNLNAGEFSFVLCAEDGTEIETVANGADGAIRFAKLEYTLADVGNYTYTVSEVVPAAGEKLAGVDYADTLYTIDVTVSDNGDGTLSVATTGDDPEALDFTNTYAATGSITFEGVKTLEGRALTVDDVFTFEVKEGTEQVATGTSDDTGKITYTEISYDLADVGEHTYTVKEVIPVDTDKVAGVTYATIEHTVTVEVSDNGDGTLLVEAKTSEDLTAPDALNFTNTYAATGSITFSGTKTLEGRNIKAEDNFTFQLVEVSNGAQVGTPTTASLQTLEGANGTFQFGQINYTLEDVGTHTYKINELSGGCPGVTYADTVYDVEVTVTDNGDGTLTAQASVDPAAIDFTNTYAATGELLLNGTKELTGRTLEDGQFTFIMTDADGNQTTVTNDANGNIAFGTLTFDQDDVGVHTYRITEQDDGKSGYSYDGTTYEIVVTVEDNATGALSVTHTVNGKADTPIAFRNGYTAEGELSITATKTLNGIAPDAEHQYSFVLTDVTDAAAPKELETVLNDEGSIVFQTIPYTEADMGKTFVYTIGETTESTERLTTDAAVYTITAKVVDNGDGSLSVAQEITKSGESEPVEEILFQNLLTAPLTITKTVVDGEIAKPFSFTIWLYDAQGNELTDAYAYTGDAAGQIGSGETLSLGHGQQITIEGLLTGSQYKVEEMAGVAYTTMVNGVDSAAISGVIEEDENLLAFVNTVRTTEFSVTKEWRGGSGPIDLTLYANGVKLEPQPVCQRMGDTYTYTLLPLYNEQNEIIVYYAKETYVDGYVTIYSNIAPYEGKTKEIYDGGTIINRPIEETDADFAITKKWEGLAEGEKQPAIQLILYCNGEATDIPTPVPTKAGRYLYYNLPEEVDGKPAVYTVVEVPVSGFYTVYESRSGQQIGYGENSGVIINTRIPATGDRMPLAAVGVAACGAAVALVVLIGLLRKKKGSK